MEEDQSLFVAFSYFLKFFWTNYIVCYASNSVGIWYMLFNSFDERETRREMSLQMIIYAKQNGAQMATFAATGTRADIE